MALKRPSTRPQSTIQQCALKLLALGLHRIVATPRANLRAVFEEDPRYWHHCQSNETQQRRRPINAKFFVHLECEQREDGSHRISRKSVRS